ncbi:MAG: ribokinase [Gemmatimonadota bacterium]|nr:ribokinase [Gemmatimonadota bacterium]
MNILNFGSLNIDLVYQVEHIARPGETIASSSHQVFAGGKGANQSAALARAGARVFHAGQVGPEGQWLVDKLAGLDVDVQHIRVGDVPTGHAIIQVDRHGQNSIVLFAGANAQIDRGDIDAALSHFGRGDILLLQNEINDIAYIITSASERDLTICLNPAPFGPQVRAYPLELVDLLIVNETEATGLAGASTLAALAVLCPHAQVALTLGAAGVQYRSPTEEFHLPASHVEVVDTTGAGDTFIGYFLQGLTAAMTARDAMARAVQAAALCVTRPGAMDSIPAADEID